MLETVAKVERSRGNRAYELVSLDPSETVRWDERVAAYPECTLFHQTVWHRYLTDTRAIEARYWMILEGSQIVGHFCAGIIKKGPFRILGSPLKGWGTNVMGPLVKKGFDAPSFLAALDRLAHQEKLAMVELEGIALDGESLAARDYHPVESWTYIVPITPEDPDAMWKGVDSTCRNRIRKAMASGLEVEQTDDPAIADEFYDQFLDVMGRQELVPPYPRSYAQSLVKHLALTGQLIALRVRDRGGKVLATGLFPHDQRTMYFWGGASWREGRDACPNELLHWTAMQLGARRQLTRYNTSGPGRFKKKFGGRLTAVPRWHKYHRRSARWGRRTYEAVFHRRLQLNGWWHRLRCADPESRA